MDQRGEKEEHSSQESPLDRRRKRKDDAAVPEEGVHGESTDDGGYEAETAGVMSTKEQAEVVVEEEASAPLLAHPRSPLQLLLRACAGCLVGLLHGYCSDDSNDPKPAAAADVAAASVAAESPREGDKAFGSEVATQVLAARRTPPGPPEEGSGGNGGSHN